MKILLELLRRPKQCIDDECDAKAVAMKMCRDHYRAWVAKTHPTLEDQASAFRINSASKK